MFYRGITLNGFHSTKRGGFNCSDEYESLCQANEKWNEENSKDEEYRLLVVESIYGERAFFQFTNEEACLKFIAEEQEIKWSSKETKVWNGDGKRMTDTY